MASHKWPLFRVYEQTKKKGEDDKSDWYTVEHQGFDFLYMEIRKDEGVMVVYVFTPITGDGTQCVVMPSGRHAHVIPLQAFRPGRPLDQQEEPN